MKGKSYLKDQSKLKGKAKLLIVGVAALLLVQLPTQAAEDGQQEDKPQPGLQLPDDLTLEKNRKIQYQEHRVAGRLESVTVTRKNGLNETYRNIRPDTIWAAAENEIGEVPNMRQWTITSW